MPPLALDVETVKRRASAAISVIDNVLKVSGTPSVSVAVLLGNDTAHVSHHGYRDVEKQIKPDAETRYAMNSMTKALIAALVGMVVDEGLLRWDTLVKEVLPAFNSCDQVVNDQTTVLDLLSHRTGITNFDPFWLGEQNRVLLDKNQAIPTFGTLKAKVPFRAGFIYNNWGYEIIREILEILTKQPISELLRSKIFVPLGMARTSTSWDTPDDNIMTSYGVLNNLSPVKIHRPRIGAGTLMEAAGGVKTTIQDLAILYKAFASAANFQFDRGTDSTPGSIFKQCRTLLSNHALLPGPSIREQGYAAGWVRAQLPGHLGRISNNPLIGEQPVVGKNSDPCLDIYHHGSMPGSTTCVHLFLEYGLVIIVLQNSLAPIDTADFIGQLLVEAVFDVQDRNDYVAIARDFTLKSLQKMDEISLELEKNRKPGTKHRKKSCYTGRYFNSIHNFMVEITEDGGNLQVSFQGKAEEKYAMKHYHEDTFAWNMTYDEAASRGRYIADYEAPFYLLRFESMGGEEIDSVHWAWDPNFPTEEEPFLKEDSAPGIARDQNTKGFSSLNMPNLRIHLIYDGI